MSEFRKLEEQFGTPKWNWWLNNCAIMWFERLKDNRLKLTLEIGPLESQKRLALLKGLKVKEKNKRSQKGRSVVYKNLHKYK